MKKFLFLTTLILLALNLSGCERKYTYTPETTEKDYRSATNDDLQQENPSR